MIKFNELRLSEDKNFLCISCYVEDLSVFEHVYITGVYVDHYSKFSSGAPTITPNTAGYKSYKAYSNDNDDTTVKTVTVRIPVAAFSEQIGGATTFEGGLFYVYVSWDGTYNQAQVVCGEDNTYIIGVIVDWQKVYAEGMNYIMSMNACSSCDDNSGFADFVLRWNALKLAIATCDYDNINDFWKKLFGAAADEASASCGCLKF